MDALCRSNFDLLMYPNTLIHHSYHHLNNGLNYMNEEVWGFIMPLKVFHQKTELLTC